MHQIAASGSPVPRRVQLDGRDGIRVESARERRLGLIILTLARKSPSMLRDGDGTMNLLSQVSNLTPT